MIRELSEKQSYEAQISQCVGVTGYHRWFFLSTLAEALKCKFVAYEVEDDDGTSLGIVPLLFRRRSIVSTVNYLPVGYIGPLLRGDAYRAGRAAELVSAVNPVVRKHRAIKIVWNFSTGLNMEPEQLQIPGFEIFDLSTYIIPRSKSPDDLWKSMSQLRRRSIKQCNSRGIVVADSSRDEITKWLPWQMTKGYPHQGAVSMYTHAEAQLLTEKLADHPRLLWRTVKSADGEVLAISGNIIEDDRLENWLMVGPHHPKISAHSLAYWDLINWALPRGLTIDFGGAPSDGVRNFKISAGCELSTGLGAMRVSNKAAYEAGRAVYNWGVRRLRGPQSAD